VVKTSLIFFRPVLAFAQQAVIRELAGTVEVKRANSEVWEAASRGQSLALDSTISTGFRSTVVIALGDSLITLRPLTRISLLELSKNQGQEKVELNLQTGRVRADVKAPEGGKTEFVIRSPNATSSVRGTVFELDTLGLKVIEGTVEFKGVSGASGNTGPSLMVDAGGHSQINGYTGRVSLPTVEVASELRPEAPIAAEPIRVSAQPPSEPVPSPGTNPGPDPGSPDSGSGPGYSNPEGPGAGEIGIVY